MQTQRRLLLASLLGLAVPRAFSQIKSKGAVGILMPTITSQRWIVDGLAMVRAMDKLGYEPELKFANDDPDTQVAQIEELVKHANMKGLVIAAVDGSKLTAALQKASEKGIKVIAYDRLIRGTPHVDYYATFDNFQVGVLQGSDIVQRLGLDKGKGPFNIELFGGSPDDNNAFFFYDGALSVLRPYIDSGKLVVGSGQLGMDKVSTLRWNGAVARARLATILEKHYTKQRLDAALSPYDGISMDLITALKKAGYGQGNLPLPVVTGQDAETPSVRAIIRGEQSSSVFKDNRELAQAATRMLDAVLSGKKPEINDEKTYNNGEKVVPTLLLKPVLVDQSNWRNVLVTSGYYKEHQFR
jgi:putative multiple sugar transport system substrate-binding protein